MSVPSPRPSLLTTPDGQSSQGIEEGLSKMSGSSPRPSLLTNPDGESSQVIEERLPSKMRSSPTPSLLTSHSEVGEAMPKTARVLVL